jgi:hypothetical protein
VRAESTRIHNSYRDALALILAELGPHAAIIRSKTDVSREPLNLSAAYPTSRPADVCLTLDPTYVSPPLLPFTKAAIDVMITSLPPPPSGDTPTQTDSVTTVHRTAERKKFNGPNVLSSSTIVNGELVIRALNDANAILLPFVVDPLGGLGPIASNLLFGTKPDPEPPPLLFPNNPTSQTAFDNATSDATPTPIAHRADTSWAREAAHIPFGGTHHSWFPSTWARQILGANGNHAIAAHLYASIRRTYDRTRRTASPDSGRHRSIFTFHACILYRFI